MTTVWWIRRDLRLHDNQALTTAVKSSGSVQPLFILDPALLDSDFVGEKRLAFLFESLRTLRGDLEALGANLLVRRGSPLEVLTQLREEIEYDRIVAERDHTPYAQARDRQVGSSLPLQRVGSTAIRLPGTVRKADDNPYVIYSPFRDRWLEQAALTQGQLLPVPERVQGTESVPGDPIPDQPAYKLADHFPIGEEVARNRLQDFTIPEGPIADYDEQRDQLAMDGTSRLSPYLRFGIISPREALVAAQEAQERQRSSGAREGSRTWIEELIWRDFYIHILNFYPRARSGSFREKYKNLPWRNDKAEFNAWQRGETGYPVVDAGMRQLKTIGWMHNRARMIVASFLVKDLLIDWRWGERHFMQHLLDGDPAANNGGWQWTAGTGTDAAPYFRVFNPVSQSKKYDPDGEYIRRWLPELAEIPDKYIHEPWKLPAAKQRSFNCRIGRDYPRPIVDHAQARQRALEVYGSVS